MNRNLLMNLTCMILIALTISPVVSLAQEQSYPDIGVMNGILAELMKDANRDEYNSSDVFGSYLPGSGLLFVVNSSDGIVSAGFLARKIALETKVRVLASIDSSLSMGDRLGARKDSLNQLVESFGKKTEESSKQIMDRLDQAIMKFLGSYADAENKLTSAQTVSVVVFLSGDSQPAARLYNVSKKNITDYRTGAVAENIFRHSVQVTDVEETDEDNSISIMATILEKSLSEKNSSDRDVSFGGADSRGVYVKGLGALFVCSVSDMPYVSDFSRSVDTVKFNTGKLKDKVILELGTYGSSLRSIRKDESILVLLKVNNFMEGEQSKLVSVKKGDIDLYTRNEIDFNTLKSRSTVIENQ
ncbi:MAG TPA: hypothetical protein VIS48_14105 [Candidatus Kryptonia bacterium]